MMTRLLFLASRDLANPHAAGGDITMYHVASKLAAEGHEILYVCSRGPGMAREERRDGLRILRAGSLFTTSPKFLVTGWSMARRWAEAIVEEAVGGLRVPYASAWYADLPRLCFWYQRNQPLFTAQYGSALGRVLSGFEHVMASLYTNAIILTPSNASMRDLVALGLPAHRILVYRPGIDDSLRRLADSGEAQREPLLLVIGKIRRYKCLHHAILVLARLHELGLRETSLIVAGRTEDEAYRQYMNSLAAELGLTGAFRIETDISEERKADLLRRARILLIPSPLEGFGRTSVEANLFGVPVVGTTGVPEDVLLEGHTGFRVPFGAVDSFAEVCARLLSNEDEWGRLSTAARSFGTRFTWNDTVNTVREALGLLGLRTRYQEPSPDPRPR